MMKTLHIQGPYEDELSEAITLLLMGNGSRLVVQTLPGMGVLYMTKNILERLGRQVIDLRINTMDPEVSAESIEQKTQVFSDNSVLIINDCTLDTYNNLPGVQGYASRFMEQGGKVIIIATY